MTRLFQIFFIFMVLVGCNKSNATTCNINPSSSTGYIRFKINGIQKECKVNFSSISSNGIYQGVAKKTATDPKEGVAISIQNIVLEGTNIITSTSTSIIVINTGGGVNDTWLAGLDTPNSTFQFIITKYKSSSPTSKYISGTFSGTLINEMTNEKAIISDGIIYNPNAE